jgi:hypothetical protein
VDLARLRLLGGDRQSQTNGRHASSSTETIARWADSQIQCSAVIFAADYPLDSDISFDTILV